MKEFFILHIHIFCKFRFIIIFLIFLSNNENLQLILKVNVFNNLTKHIHNMILLYQIYYLNEHCI